MTPGIEELRKALEETFSNPEIHYVTFELAGENWLMRRFTKAPENAANPLASQSPPLIMGEGWEGRAAELTIYAADTLLPAPERDPSGMTVEHAAWMLNEIRRGEIAGRKAHRWLGYAQALLVRAGLITLEAAKLANKRASDEAAAPSSDPLMREKSGG